MKDTIPLISIIVPIYKVEPYLRKCVDSILNQTYTNLEIILVDDGSPDNCGAICDEYARKDSRIRVIHKPNGGLSDARNAGMDIMTGSLVGFVDSDDWIEPQMYQRLYELMAQYDADMAFGGVADDVIRDGVVQTVKTSEYGVVPYAEGKENAMRRYFHGSWAAWDKLYRVDLFDGIRYPVGEINEDEAIVLHLLDRCRRVCYTNEVFYHYIRRVDGTSITTASFSEKKLVWAKHCRDNLAFIRKKYPQLEQDALARYRGSILWLMREIAMQKDGYEEHWNSLRRELMENYNAFRIGAGKRDRILMILFRYFPRKLAYTVFTKRSK
ncbi:MAG: glycosyltransferase [Oscillospiraceae bacterium]|nr:glycosyltransferase [Oscillospiraceae bacterium]